MNKYLLFLLIILAILVGGCSSETTTQEEIVIPVIEQEAAPVEKISAKSVGESFIAGDFTWKITKITTAAEIGERTDYGFFGEEADGVFLIVDVEVENTGKKAAYLSDSYLKLIDDQDREFSSDTMAAIYLNEDTALAFEEINPGIKKKGQIVFDVPEGLSVANVRIQSSLFESEYYNVKIDILN